MQLNEWCVDQHTTKSMQNTETRKMTHGGEKSRDRSNVSNATTMTQPKPTNKLFLRKSKGNCQKALPLNRVHRTLLPLFWVPLLLPRWRVARSYPPRLVLFPITLPHTCFLHLAGSTIITLLFLGRPEENKKTVTSKIKISPPNLIDFLKYIISHLVFIICLKNSSLRVMINSFK